MVCSLTGKVPLEQRGKGRLAEGWAMVLGFSIDELASADLICWVGAAGSCDGGTARALKASAATLRLTSSSAILSCKLAIASSAAKGFAADSSVEATKALSSSAREHWSMTLAAKVEMPMGETPGDRLNKEARTSVLMFTPLED